MRLLLDTSAFLALDREGLSALSKTGRALVSDPEHEILLSSVSITEIAIKTAIGKLRYSAAVVNKVAERLQVTITPYEDSHANALFDLPLHHRDPFDRMLIATALVEDCSVVTSDRIFAKYGINAIW